MTLLKILWLTVGFAFSTFGYFIYFKKKYHLINGFEADYKAGRKTESTAKKVGLIELIIGIISIFMGIGMILID